MFRVLVVGIASSLLIGCQPNSKGVNAPPASSTEHDQAAHQAHENYVRGINSNNIDQLTSVFADDVVFLSAGARPIVGKTAVRDWADGYFKSFTTKWDKSVKDFVISGDYAFERYDYTSTDTPVGGGKPVVDTGWGLVVYHREQDGVWRVARDAFSSDHAASAQ
jgi:ketosteroid isomerase-like protein